MCSNFKSKSHGKSFTAAWVSVLGGWTRKKDANYGLLKKEWVEGWKVIDLGTNKEDAIAKTTEDGAMLYELWRLVNRRKVNLES